MEYKSSSLGKYCLAVIDVWPWEIVGKIDGIFPEFIRIRTDLGPRYLHIDDIQIISKKEYNERKEMIKNKRK